MTNRLYILITVLAVLMVLLFIRAGRQSEDEAVEAKVVERYLVCDNCGAQYRIPKDYFANIQKDDMEIKEDSSGGSTIVRCRECGEIAARPGMVVEMGGEVVDVSGARYDAEKGLD